MYKVYIKLEYVYINKGMLVVFWKYLLINIM